MGAATQSRSRPPKEMIMNRRNLLLIGAALAFAPFAAPLTAQAHEFKLGDLVIGHPWARATSQARPGAGYLKIHNHGATADRLIGAETRIAAKAELHNHVMENNVAKMVPVEAIEIPAGGMAELKPHSFHLMFMELKQPLAEGDTFPVTLIFEHAGRIEVTFVTAAAGAIDPEAH
jgi:copper(I)-binding protein